MSLTLDENTHAQIKKLCAEGDSLVTAKSFTLALKKYEEALTLLSKPVIQWDAATWIYAAIGDTLFLSGDLDKALVAFTDAIKCPGGVGNPFIHLRLGEIQFELGNEIIAADELTRAYMGGGKEIFEGEPTKYFALLCQKLKEPPTGW